jgi:hypothetical protein
MLYFWKCSQIIALFWQNFSFHFDDHHSDRGTTMYSYAGSVLRSFWFKRGGSTGFFMRGKNIFLKQIFFGKYFFG